MSQLLEELHEARRAWSDAQQALAAAQARADTATGRVLALAEQALQHPLQDPVEGLPPPCDYRRAHRPGRPAKLDADAELRAFILARIDVLTFPQLEEEVAKAFPPDRRVSKSTIHAWWQKHRNALAGNSHPR